MAICLSIAEKFHLISGAPEMRRRSACYLQVLRYLGTLYCPWHSAGEQPKGQPSGWRGRVGCAGLRVPKYGQPLHKRHYGNSHPGYRLIKDTTSRRRKQISKTTNPPVSARYHSLAVGSDISQSTGGIPWPTLMHSLQSRRDIHYYCRNHATMSVGVNSSDYHRLSGNVVIPALVVNLPSRPLAEILKSSHCIPTDR